MNEGKPEYSVIKRKCPGVSDETINRHIDSLDSEYFRFFDEDTVALHVREAYHLSAELPVRTVVGKTKSGEAQCTVIALDYPSVFSIITGLLGANGFNIISGISFTYQKTVSPDNISRKGYRKRTSLAPISIEKKRKIVDFFTGEIDSEVSIKAWKKKFDSSLTNVFRIIEGDKKKGIELAKQKVHEYVAETLSRTSLKENTILYPVEINIENEGGRTKLTVTSADTPFFLYAVSNALALHKVSVESVHIQTIDRNVVDEFEIVDLKGNPITSQRHLDQIKFSILFTKQFTYFLWRAPDPFQALLRFENMLQDIVDNTPDMSQEKYLSDPIILHDLATLLGASDFLWEDFIRSQYETIITLLTPKIKHKYFSHTAEEMKDALAASLTGCRTTIEKKEVLNRFKDRETYLIDLDHILKEKVDFMWLSAKLTELAEMIVSWAVRIMWEELAAEYGVPRTVAGLEASYTILGLGKLGGAALGYASDIELMFIYGDQGTTDGNKKITNVEFFEELFKKAVLLIDAKQEGIFRVDLRLRPYGKSGPIACSLEEFCRYYGAGESVHSFELLALIRMRRIGGDDELGKRIERLRNEFVFATDKIDLGELRTLREKQLQEKTSHNKLNAKFSPGALVDLEYTVQILQYMYGRDYPGLQTPRIHIALEELVRAGIMTNQESDEIVEAYHFFRRLINGLRMLRGSAEDLFLPATDSDEYLHLARRMGYNAKNGITPSKLLSLDFKTVTATIRKFVEHFLGRDWIPERNTGNAADLVLSDSISSEQRKKIFSDAGFYQGDRAYVNLKALAGSGRRNHLFARLSVLAWDILALSPDPDMALNNWERFEHSIADIENHYEELLHQPKRLEILLQVFASSQFLADILIKYPEVYNWVTDPERIHTLRDRERIAEDLQAATAQCENDEEWANTVRRFRKREILRIAIRDICLKVSIEHIVAELSELADAVIETTLNYIQADAKKIPFCICALGKLGGSELNYSSDLDIIGILDIPAGTSKDDAEAVCAKWMEKIRSLLSDHTSEGYAYRIDFRLRPYGRSGNIVYTRTAITEYYRNTASLWEIQALLKLRPVAGNMELGAHFLASIRPLLIKTYVRREVIETIQHLRKEAIKKSAGSFLNGEDIKSGEGGIRDIEFLLQGFQLVFCKAYPELVTGNTIEGLRHLGEKNLIPSSTAEELIADYTFLRRIEHFLQLLEDRQTHTLPKSERERKLLARRISRPGNDAKEFYSDVEETLKKVHSLYNEHLLGLKENNSTQ